MAGPTLAFGDIKDVNASWRTALHSARHRMYARGEHVKLGEELLFLERGRMRLIYQNSDGMEKILWYIREGCIFGEAAFFDRGLTDYYCICTSACSVYAFSLESVERINREDPELIFNLLGSIARKVKMSACQASSLCMDSILVRICKFLSQRIVPGSDPPLARIGISRQEMASLLGVHRVSLYRALRREERRGLFGNVAGDVITIMRPQDFYRLAGRDQ